ncbi:MAG: P-II family nitrogen regulator [Nitrospirota bacterium]|jgi:nitrogen regulatory protein P-II 1
MKKITAVIRPEKLEEVRAALEKMGYPGLMLTRIEGHGTQKGLTQQFRGREYTIEMLPKIKLEIVANGTGVQDIVRTIIDVARTGNVGDGKIFVSPVEEVYRIRTGARDKEAL